MPDMIHFSKEFFDWQVILDIIVFTAIFFTIYKTLRASGTGKIAIGLLLAVFTSLVASVLNLRGLEWLFSNLSQVAFIALLIIFQPEVRRILEHSILFGKKLHIHADENLASLLDEVLFDLSLRHWGALVILPGKHPLRQWLTEGIPLDAYPSHSLLLSLFDPDSPGHDGAVLFEKGKVSRFGIRLPLSETNSLPQKYGTRHHAALGLAEKTDAMILAVSEERGTVSVFSNSNMVELKKRGDLKILLLSYEKLNHTRSVIPEIVRRYGRLSLEIFACFIFATLFWFIVISGKTDFREVFITVPIEYGHPPTDLILSENRLEEAKLLLEGPLILLDNLNSSQVRLKVNLSGMAAGRQVVNLTDENVDLPKKIKILDIYPPNLNLELYKMTFRKLSVKPQFVGELEEGYKIDGIEINPSLVDVSISQEEAGQKELLTTPIYLQGIRMPTTVYCKIVAPYGLQPKDKRWPDISVTINVVKTNK